ncbi:MAG: hypothetical protein AB2749_06205, partial [Candidatus Thiodiazotropha endolucinida]
MSPPEQTINKTGIPIVPLAGIVNWLDRLRLQLSRHDALLILSVLGLICGFVTGIVIILFRLLVESSQAAILPGGGVENYEA